MAVNETVVEVVRFTEKGLSEIDARTKAFAGEIDEVAKRQKVLLGVLADPRFQKHQQRIDGMRKQYELMTLRARNVATAQSLADGSAARHLRSVTKLNEQYERMRREVELVAKYGERTGQVLARYGGVLGGMGRAGVAMGGMAAASAGGMARSGFEGTVELNRFNAEMKMLSRELAAAFKPLMTVATKAVRTGRRGMESMGPGGQNAIMYGGMGVMGLGAWKLATWLTGAPSPWTTAKWAGRQARAGLRGIGGGHAARGAGRAAPVVAAGIEGYDEYTRYRDTGFTKRNVAHTGLRAIDVAPGGSILRRAFDRNMGRLGFGGGNVDGGAMGAGRGAAPPAPPEARRAVTLAGGGWEEVGSGHARLNTAIGMTEGKEDDSEEALGPVLKKLSDVLDRLEQWLTGDEGPGAGIGALDRPGG